MIKIIDFDRTSVIVGKNLTSYRKLKDESILSLSIATGISEECIRQIESGDCKCLTFEQLIALCNHFEVTMQQLFDLEVTQIFNYSQNNYPGSKRIVQKNNLSSGYLAYIKDLKAELKKYKVKAGESEEEKEE